MKNKNLLSFVIVLIVFLLVPLINIYAQEVIKQPLSLQSLDAQINLTEQINTKILNTIYWALGGLITVFLAIIGLNFFQNFNLNKRKIEDIEKEIKNSFKNSILELKEENKKNQENLKKDFELKIKSGIELSFKEIQNKFSKLKEDFDELNRNNLIRSAFDHKKRGEMGYILNLIDVLNYDIKKNWDWRINESLDYISECLDVFHPDSNSLTKLQIILGKLPEEYNLQKKHIESKMKVS